MKRIQRTSKSILVHSSTGLLVIRGYTLEQTTIDNLENDIFNYIFQYLSTQFDFALFQLNSNQITFYCGVILEEDNVPVSSELDKEFTPHLDHIMPSMLSYDHISGYNVTFDFLSEMTLHENAININNTFQGVFSLYDLDILQYHSSLLKILLDDENASLYYSHIQQGSKSQYYLTLRLKGSSYLEYQTILERFTQSMKQSPYISGKIYFYTLSDIRKNPGLYSMGITEHTVSKNAFYTLMKIIPSFLPQPGFITVPTPFRRINLSDIVPDISELSEIDSSTSQTSNISISVDQSENSVIPELQLEKSFTELGWKLVNITECSDFSFATLSNKNLVIHIVFNLQDPSLDPQSITQFQSQIVFLFISDYRPGSNIHSNWTILSDTAKIKSLTFS